jgi:hypothetical protein
MWNDDSHARTPTVVEERHSVQTVASSAFNLRTFLLQVSPSTSHQRWQDQRQWGAAWPSSSERATRRPSKVRIISCTVATTNLCEVRFHCSEYCSFQYIGLPSLFDILPLSYASFPCAMPECNINDLKRTWRLMNDAAPYSPSTSSRVLKLRQQWLKSIITNSLKNGKSSQVEAWDWATSELAGLCSTATKGVGLIT